MSVELSKIRWLIHLLRLLYLRFRASTHILTSYLLHNFQKMARDFLKARMMAPPRPHPMAPQSGGLAQKAAGMQANVLDKV